jgi:thiamine-monophosphate kinase
MSGPSAWALDFLAGVEAACESYALPLIGGDTIALPDGAPRVLGLTAIGYAGSRVPDRAGGRPEDRLWLVGTVGDAAAGLAQLLEDKHAAGPLVDIYRRPVPLLVPGQALAAKAHAMMDVSDGLLLDLTRMIQASGCGAEIALEALPLSRAFIAERGERLESRLFAATGGDDYALLAALPRGLDPSTLSLPKGTTIACIGHLVAGPPSIRLTSEGRPVELPERLGFEHSDYEHRGVSGPPVADRP